MAANPASGGASSTDLDALFDLPSKPVTDEVFPRPVDGSPTRTPHDIVEDYWSALTARWPGQFFSMGGSLVLVDDGQTRHMTAGSLISWLDAAATCRVPVQKKTGVELQHRRPNGDDRTSMCTAPKVPPLVAVRSAPFVTYGGRVVNRAGYDEETGYFLKWPADEMVADPDAVSDDDVRTCIGILLDGYTFAQDGAHQGAHNYTHALAAVLLTVTRPGIKGPTPIHAFNAPMIEGAGAGKSLFATMISALLRGDPEPPISVLASWGAEAQRFLDGALLKTPEIIFMDNMPTGAILGGNQLHAYLTGTKVDLRIVGHGELVTVPIRCMWMVTANQMDFDNDQVRRTIITNFVPGQKANRKEDLIGYVIAERTWILSCLLRIVDQWHKAGMPNGVAREMRTYTEWARIIGGLVEFAATHFGLGLPGMFLSPDATPIPREVLHWYRLIEDWPRELNLEDMNSARPEHLSAKQVLAIADERSLGGIINAHKTAASLGHKLSDYVRANKLFHIPGHEGAYVLRHVKKSGTLYYYPEHLIDAPVPITPVDADVGDL